MDVSKRSLLLVSGAVVAATVAVTLLWKLWRRHRSRPQIQRNEASFGVIREAVLEQWRAYDVERNGYLQLEEARNLTSSLLYSLVLDKTILAEYLDALIDGSSTPIQSPASSSASSSSPSASSALSLDFPYSSRQSAHGASLSDTSSINDTTRAALLTALREVASDLHSRREEVFRQLKARVEAVDKTTVVGSEFVTALSISLESILYLEVLSIL